ncbi:MULTISPECIES: hypothetical protein [Sphingomonas]|uniref:hypothetical protein n=1 Tax=Sphingomonas TaxID=13687 RepID=UPI000DEFFAC6|nr:MULTISPECIES: hypothetical protein [Sphingomonas]
MTRLTLTALIAVGIATAADASTPQAWAQMNRQVDRTCLAAAKLTRAKIIADKASFDDRVPIELRIVEGYNKQSVVDVKLCAYDRRTKRAAITDGVGRLGVNRR